MSKYIMTTALGAALIVGTAVFAHDGQMHHLPTSSTTDNSFDAQMGRAMELMNRDMMVAPSGDPDRDFAAMMIPHHQGAVDMARHPVAIREGSRCCGVWHRASSSSNCRR